MRRSLLLPLFSLWVVLSTNRTYSQSPVELAQRIDQLVEQTAVGPLAHICNDADFLRRVTLDLTGVIPTAEHVSSFLAEPSPDKRLREIERLLASPEFNRFMTLQLSVTLLERRTEKNIPQRNWERYLYESLEADKSLDQVMSELVYAEPAGAQHPANKFLLCREVEPNAVTRDVGRLAFGMDLQCAQCHNHPLVETYYQADYYGLYAFLHRTSLFTQPSTKQVRLAEKPDGEASFRSVFTGNARDHTTPRLPKESSLLEEPILLGDEVYQEKPGKESGGIPSFSRRQALAKMMRGSRQFQRNMANRLWALMFSRGIVHPLDFHHRDNPPTNPELLDTLTDALVANQFKIRPLLQAIAMSRCYQRTCEAPSPDALNYADIAARCELLQGKLSTLKLQTESLRSASAAADSAYQELLGKHDTQAIELTKAAKLASDAQSEFKKAEEAFQKADAPYQKSRAQSEALKAAVEKLTAAEKLMADDKQLVDISTKLNAKSNKLADTLPGLEKLAKEKLATLEKCRSELTQKQADLATAQAARIPVDQLQNLEKTLIAADSNLAEHLFKLDQYEKQIALCKLLSDYQSQQHIDPAKAAAVWSSIVEHWTVKGQVAPLKSLTPEQLTLSALQGSGMLTKHVGEATAQAKSILAKAEAKAKSTEQASTEPAKADSPAVKKPDAEVANDKPGTLPALEQQKLIDIVRGRLDQFATLYGGLPGEDFQATVNQALFFGNGNIVDEWLKAGQNNLTDELAKLEPPAVAEKMFLSILSRYPLQSERQDVQQSLSVAGVDRPEVIKRWLWALLASSEFRFNH